MTIQIALGLIVSSAGCSCLLILFAEWLNGIRRETAMKQYIWCLRQKYELSK